MSEQSDPKGLLELEHIARFQRSVRGNTFLDIGANEGRWARAMIPNFRQVWAFEPHPAAFQVLFDQMNVYCVNNGLDDRGEEKIILVDAAVSRFDGKTLLSCYESSLVSTLLPRALSSVIREPLRYMEVKVCSLDNLERLKTTQVDFVKIDTEGTELDVVKGGLKLFDRCRPNLFIELHRPEDVSEMRDLLPWAAFEEHQRMEQTHLVYIKNPSA